MLTTIGVNDMISMMTLEERNLLIAPTYTAKQSSPEPTPEEVVIYNDWKNQKCSRRDEHES